MKIIAVDNEKLALDSLSRTIKTAIPDAELRSYNNSLKAMEEAGEFSPDVAFLDIEMPGMDGMALAKRLKEQVNPRINIIFTTAYSEYLEKAFTQLRSSGYLIKPITVDAVINEINNLRNPIEPVGKKRIRVRCFGNFEVYIDGRIPEFKYTKTRELLACMIDHRGMCQNAELIDNLWEDISDGKGHGSYLQNLISDLCGTLAKSDCRDIIIKKRGSIGIDESKVDCDYYEYLNNNPAAVNAFFGEYMKQYSWAEETLAGLLNLNS